MNGASRELESYNESKPTITWHLSAFDDAVNLVNHLDGLSKKIEFWHIPNSFYYYDCLSVKINTVTMNSWRVTLKLALYPFRYAKVSQMPQSQATETLTIQEMFSVNLR